MSNEIERDAAIREMKSLMTDVEIEHELTDEMIDEFILLLGGCSGLTEAIRNNK